MKIRNLSLCIFAIWATSAFAGVTVTAPANNSNVTSPVQYVATATSSCSKGVASMGIYTAPNKLAYVVNGASLNTNLTLSPGTYYTTVEEWDNCGGAATEPITITVGSGGPGVSVSTPLNNSQVTSPTQYVATATTSCDKGVASMGIYTAPYKLAYSTNGASLNTNLNLSPGNYNTTVQEWDNCGGSATAPVSITVTSGGYGVVVTSPANDSTVSSPVHYVASATTSCTKGIASMGIYTGNDVLAYVVNGASLDTYLTLANGTYYTTVQDWDNCGGSAKVPITITVTGGSSGGSTFYSLQTDTAGWTGYGLLPPSYAICSSCKPSGPNVTWSWTPNVGNPSMDGKSTETTIGGDEDYSDVLWNNHLIGNFSSQGMPDTDHTIVPSLHNFTYDVWFYLSNNTAPQALEFDINQFENGKSFIWGHECRVAGGNEWDTWDNPGQYWVKSGIGCYPIVGWNHLTIQVERTSGDQLLFQSITLNGVTNNVNRTDNPTSTSWYGITINYQIDGNYKQEAYTVYLDELNFTYQ